MTPRPFALRDRQRLARRIAVALAVSLGLHALLVLGVPARRMASQATEAGALAARLVERAPAPAPAAEPQPPVSVPDQPTHATPPAEAESKSASPPRTPVSPADPPALPAAQDAGASLPAEPEKAALPVPFDPVYYTWREVDVPAAPLGDGSPPYPPAAERDKLTGTVKLEVWIDERGNVTDAQIIRSEPPEVFDEITLAHYRALKFSPAMKDGRPVRVRLRFGVDFVAEPVTSGGLPGRP